eukprot:jgi/Tetstr1/433823/TSEL_023009.t1
MLLRELRECAGLKGGTPRSSEAKPKALAPPGGVVATAGARPPVREYGDLVATGFMTAGHSWGQALKMAAGSTTKQEAILEFVRWGDKVKRHICERCRLEAYLDELVLASK